MSANEPQLNLLEELWRCQRKNIFTDIQMYVSSGEIVRCHRMMLALALPWLDDARMDAVLLPASVGTSSFLSALKDLYCHLDPAPLNSLLFSSHTSQNSSPPLLSSSLDNRPGEQTILFAPTQIDPPSHILTEAHSESHVYNRTVSLANSDFVSLPLVSLHPCCQTKTNLDSCTPSQEVKPGDVRPDLLSHDHDEDTVTNDGSLIEELKEDKLIVQEKKRDIILSGGEIASGVKLEDSGKGGEATFPCPECGRMLASRITLREHLKRHKGLPKLPCPLCEKQLASAEGLRKHVRSVHKGVRPHACQHCSYAAALPAELLKHTESHHLGIKHECEICHQLLSSRSSLHLHKKLHTAEKAFTCPDCGVSFRRKNHLELHIERIHSKIQYECGVCGKRLKSKEGLSYHMLYHNPESHFSCPHCNKKFVARRQLNFHLNTHTGTRPFPCPAQDCGKTFSSPDQLSHHKKYCRKSTACVRPVSSHLLL